MYLRMFPPSCVCLPPLCVSGNECGLCFRAGIAIALRKKGPTNAFPKRTIANDIEGWYALSKMAATHPVPSWCATLLSDSTVPTLPLPTELHDKPAHPTLTPVISDARLHPALEAALHLANGDLYNAHFLVRKAQGGGKELDWGHAILHRLEGDMGNAKVGGTENPDDRYSTADHIGYVSAGTQT